MLQGFRAWWAKRRKRTQQPPRKQRQIFPPEPPDPDDDSLWRWPEGAELYSVLAGGGGGVVGPDIFDVVVTAKAPEMNCTEVGFWSLHDELLVVLEEGTADVAPLAAAVEKKLQPPYKALAARQTKNLWGVGAVSVQLSRFAFSDGDLLTLGKDEVTSFTVDGTPSDAAVPQELLAAGEQVSRDFYIEANRIDGDLWELEITRL